jgi:hypothetical protein
MDPGAILPTTSMTTPSSMMPQPSGYVDNNNTYNNGTNNNSTGGDYCARRPSPSNKTSRAVSRSARGRHHARRAGHGTNMGL